MSTITYNKLIHIVTNKIQAGNKCLYSLQNLIKSKQLTRRIKTNLHTTFIRPVVIYDNEGKRGAKTCCGKKIARKIFVMTTDQATGRYSMETNKELEK